MPVATRAPKQNDAGNRATRALRQEVQTLRRQALEWERIADELRALAFALDAENEQLYNRVGWDGIDPETGEIFPEHPLPRDAAQDVAAFCAEWWGSDAHGGENV